MRTLFLDVDGVLNRTGFRPDVSLGLRSWIEPELADRLSNVLRRTNAQIVIASDWRRGRDDGLDDAAATAIVALFAT